MPDEIGVRSGRHVAALIAIFALAAAIRFWFNFAATHVNCYQTCDASEYLRNAIALKGFLATLPSILPQAVQCLTGNAAPAAKEAVASAVAPLSDFYISGPVFPAYLLTCLIAGGGAVSIDNWPPLLAVQSILSALMCVFIALSAEHAFSRRLGYLAGFLSCFYPGFIINSGRLYTESFAAFLLSFIMWLTVRGFTRNGNGKWANIASGFLSAALQLTRSTMFVLSLALLPVLYLQRKRHRPLQALLCFVIGFALVQAPWLAMGRLAFGKGSLVVDRISHYNFFIGNDVPAQGWLSYPYQDGTGIEQRSMLTLWKESVHKAGAARWLSLQFDKPPRLFQFPWNDFRLPIGAVSFYAQVSFHQILLLLSLLGMALCAVLTRRDAPLSVAQSRSRLFILGVFLLHQIYLAFITVPRYNLTGMPAMIIFAAAGGGALAALIKSRSSRRPAAALVLAACLFFLFTKLNTLPVLAQVMPSASFDLLLFISCATRAIVLIALLIACIRVQNLLSGQRRLAMAATLCAALALFPSLTLPVRAHGRAQEWVCPLDTKGQNISSSIALKKSISGTAYLMIDAEGARSLSNGTEVWVNNEKLDGPIIPSLSLVQDLSAFKYMGSRPYLECEYIFDCMTVASGIANTDLRQWFLIPLPETLTKAPSLEIRLLKSEDTPSKFFGTYESGKSSATIPSWTVYSWEKAFYGVENEEGLTDCRYDTKISSSLVGSSQKNDLSPLPGLQNGNYLIRLLVPSDSADSARFTQVSQVPLNTQGEGEEKVTQLPSYDKSSLWLVRVKGKVKAAGGKGLPTIELRVRTRQGDAYISPWMPRFINAGDKWTTIDQSFPLMPGKFKSPIDSIEITRRAKSPFFKSVINAPQTSAASISWKDLSLQIYRMPKNPVTSGFELQ